MTEPTQEQIERIREAAIYQRHSISLTSSCVIDICNMALRPHDAEQRAQRAEALLRRARPILAGQQRVSWQLVDDMDAALATPPPEVEHGSDKEDMDRLKYRRSLGLHRSNDAPHTPEQAHGDALAAFDRLCNWFDIPGDDDDAKIPEAAYLDYQQVRQALTASGVPEDRDSAIWLVAEIMDKFMSKPPGPSDGPFEFQPKFARDALYRQAERAIDNAGESGSGVPYVPESIQRLPDVWLRRSREWKDTRRIVERRQMEADAAELRHEIERSLASAPAVPSGHERVDRAFAREAFESAQRADQDALNGKVPNERDTMKAMNGCQRLQSMIAAAPTDGREHD